MKSRILLPTVIFVVAVSIGLGLGGLLFSQADPLAHTPSGVTGDQPTPFSIEGLLVEVGSIPGVWSVDLQRQPATEISFNVLAETEIIPDDATAAPGVWAVIEGLKWPDRGREATRVELQVQPRPVLVRGQLKAVPPALMGRWVIESYPFQVDAETEIIANGVAPERGAWAQAELLKLPRGLKATSVELLAGATGSGPAVTLLDILNAVDGRSGLWEVGQTQVLVPSADIVQGDPRIGDLLLVHGRQLSDARVQAAGIQVILPDEENYIHGTIRSLAQEAWLVDDITVLIDDSVTISGVAPSVGKIAQVVGSVEGRNRVRARAIEVLDPPEEPLLGWLLERPGDETLPQVWQVNLSDGAVLRAVSVELTADTLLDDSAAPAQYSAWLEFLATPIAGSHYRASQIVVLSRPPKRQVLGPVEARPASGVIGQWTVASYRVFVDSDTGVVGSPAVGSLVKVAGWLDRDNSLHAELLQVYVP